MTKALLGGKKTGPNPINHGKRGVKRSLLTEGYGVPIGLAVDGANWHDMKLVQVTLERMVAERPTPTADEPQGMCLDKGYDYDDVRTTWRRLASPLISMREATGRKGSSRKPANGRAGGWWTAGKAG